MPTLLPVKNLLEFGKIRVFAGLYVGFMCSVDVFLRVFTAKCIAL